MSAPVVTLARRAPLDFTDEQRQLIRDTFASGCSDAEFAVLMEVARARRLSPILKQIHFVQRWDADKGRMVWSAQTSIDGLRAVAERTGLYQGQDEPEFVENEDGTLKLCKVRVWRRDWPRPAVGVAYWAEYVQTTRDKATGKTRPTAMWSRMPHVMLSKVAEAIALRKAFPEDAGGLYTADEMAQASSDASEGQAPAPTATVPAYLPPELPAPAPAPRAEVAAPVEAPPVEAPVVPPPAPAPVAERQLERVVDVAEPPPAELPAGAERFYARVAEIEIPSEAVAVWMRHRAELADLTAPAREAAWNALVKRTEEVGKMKNAKVWLKKAIAEEEARGGAAKPRPVDAAPGQTWTQAPANMAVA